MGAQTNSMASEAHGETASDLSADSYVVIGATQRQEALLRAQIRAMRPAILPLRIVFVPHWKYLDNARILHLHVPTGYASVMFTHLPSRTVFVDTVFYSGENWLGHWIAHELGHLETNSVREDEAEEVAKILRMRLREAILPSIDCAIDRLTTHVDCGQAAQP